MFINHNLAALNAYRNYTSNSKSIAKTMKKLATGLRIAQASDDAAGLAIAEGMRSQIQSLNQASNNSQDAISLLQTAEGALAETHSVLRRMRELSIQAANDTNTSNDRIEIQKEVDQLKNEVDRIANTTFFNNKNLLDGTAAALTSTDKESTKVLVRNGLRTTDSSGLKVNGSGNFKLDIQANPGQAQIQKSDIFKINHGEGPVVNVKMQPDSGINKVSGAEMQYGTYGIATQKNLVVAGPAAKPFDGYEQQSILTSPNANANFFVDSSGAKAMIQAGANNYSGTLLVEITGVNIPAANQLTARVQAHLMRRTDGKLCDIDVSGVVMNMTAPSLNNIFSIPANFDSIPDSLRVRNISGLPLGGINPVNPQFAVGDKVIVSFTSYIPAPPNPASHYEYVSIEAGYNGSGPVSAWNTAGKVVNNYFIQDDILNNKTTDFKFYTLDTDKNSVFYGKVYDNKVTLSLGGLATKNPATSFDYVPCAGQIALPYTQLKDIDKFYDADGKFLLDDPQSLTLVQGDGTKTTIQVFGADTLLDLINKLNDAIGNGLGQNNLIAGADQGKFASYVYDATGNSPEAVAGTMVIRSAKAGKDGQLSIIGNEAFINALSLKVIQDSTESRFKITVTNAHDSNQVIAKDISLDGDTLIGVVNPNVDVKFDSNANIITVWNATTKSFDLTGDITNPYSAVVHLVDRSQVFQIGSNQLQDMNAGIGDMSSEGLGIQKICVLDRDSAGRAIAILDNAIERVSTQRSSLGAVQNRLEHTINNLGVSATNLTVAESHIRDADMASEVIDLSKKNTLTQVAETMLAQANQQPQSILSLLNK